MFVLGIIARLLSASWRNGKQIFLPFYPHQKSRQETELSPWIQLISEPTEQQNAAPQQEGKEQLMNAARKEEEERLGNSNK